MQNVPKTISVSLQTGQLDKVRCLAETLANRDEYTSRSSIIRQALNIGLRCLIEREELDGTAGVQIENEGVCSENAL
jgi:Arc/MetJ-type ribon-helix-helix transcriptional regulator